MVTQELGQILMNCLRNTLNIQHVLLFNWFDLYTHCYNEKTFLKQESFSPINNWNANV